MRAKFVLTEAATGLWRNVTMTVAMILTTAISLFLLGGGGLLYQQVEQSKELLYANVEVTIFLKDDVTNEQREGLEQRLEGDNLVESVEHESKEEAHRRFQELFKNSPDLANNVKPEALPESFRVKLKDPTEFAEMKKRYGATEGVYRVQDQQDLLGAVFQAIDGIQLGAFVVAFMAGIAAILLIANTIQVAAYSRRREVGIMKLVGASNWYVRLPFILEAAVAGLIGATVAFSLLALCKVFLLDRALKPLRNIVPEIEWGTIIATGPVLMAVSVAIASIAGWATLRFYVKV
jgi:cell division transport system permease protein